MVKPGESYGESLPLTRYCRFDGPGTYALRARHDLGWKEQGGRKIPEGQAAITLVRPTPAQARAVVEAMERLGKDHWAEEDGKTKPYADFTALRDPAYLPILVERAEAGSTDAMEGLGGIATPEATLALIRLLGHRVPRLVLPAARALNMRLPDPEFTGKLGPRNAFDNALSERRQWLIDHSWREEFALQARDRARTFLAAGDEKAIRTGAFMIECVGTGDDLPALVGALDRAIKRTADVPREDGIYPVPRGACMELLRAARILVLRDAKVPSTPKSPGEAALWLTALKSRDTFRPKGWENEALV
ncbi:MAG: hypothetical protein LC745_06685, partial [Planctomycetia bacterium]|nr:hypothetical protein [Planctomycetia bacterium]